MPIVNADVKNLEGCVFADLSCDKTMIAELNNKEDLHTNNQTSFGLPSRLVAKRFLFKLVYGATAYGFATDPDFLFMNYSKDKWQGVIDSFYKKYDGGAAWHRKIVSDAQTNGRLTIPSGRYFPFEPVQVDGRVVRDRSGAMKWPLTQIKNYPVQGFGADLVMLARLQAFKKLREGGMEAKLICTIHDSIVADCPEHETQAVAKLLFDSIREVPALCEQVWNYKFKVALSSEVQAGKNKYDMEEIA